jgi:hypothetical protein
MSISFPGTEKEFVARGAQGGCYVSIEWFFDDGGYASGLRVYHTYNSVGPHPTTIRITLEDGSIHSKTKDVPYHDSTYP